MNFGNAVVSAYKNAFKYSGRASRSEFWWFSLFGALVSLLLLVGSITISFGQVDLNSEAAVLDAFLTGVLIATAASWIVVGIPFVSALTRRLHDMGRSGNWTAVFAPLQIFVAWGFFAGTASSGLEGVLKILGIVLNVFQIVLLIFCVMPSDMGNNKYGAPAGAATDSDN